MEQPNEIGYKLYHSNVNLRNFANVMENPEFQQFYHAYLSDINQRDVTLFMLHAYAQIYNQFPSPKYSGYERLAFLKDALHNSNIRESLVQSFRHPLLALENINQHTKSLL